MTILTDTDAASGAAARAGDRLMRAWRTWRRSRRTYASLYALSDHDLRDIGLARDELGSVARHWAQRL